MKRGTGQSAIALCGAISIFGHYDRGKSIAGLTSQSNCYLRTSITFSATRLQQIAFISLHQPRSNFSRVKDQFDNFAE